LAASKVPKKVGVIAVMPTISGFSLLITPNFDTFDAATPRVLNGFGYTKLIFSIRGTLSANTSLEVTGPDDGDSTTTATTTEYNSSQIGSSWTELTLTVPNGEFASVKSYASFTFIYRQPGRTTDPGNGGLIYLDNIRYE